MKTFFYQMFSLFLFLVSNSTYAQVEIDGPIELTGQSGDRFITNLELPVNPTDAASKEYVDANAGGFTHFIGELFGGGVIVELWKVNGIEHGLIVSPQNLSTGGGQFYCEWSGNTSSAIGVGSQNKANGQANTLAMIAQNNQADKAATLCDAYINPDMGTGVYSDWYLPSIWELQSCLAASHLITRALGETNGIQLQLYWSSTEYNGSLAWRMGFTSDTSWLSNKNWSGWVRAVRQF